MKKKIRPLSPHLNIYKPQLTSILSIFHRISGSLLTLTFLLFLCCFYIDMFYNNFFISYAIFYDLNQTFIVLVNFFYYFLILVVSFHISNGLRHLSWDFCIGLEIKNLYTTGIIVLCIATLLIIIVILV
uniref:Succinate:cytochrome c oxidoreductase subunit 3 n=1 Tax=Proteomonas sulcata TaxID=77928 RepID=A0A2P1G8B8_9CRYP|nr:succinate:cytochrome c oxidoreductase subunit 3 [Proteomonas sulcata]AVM81202.1 succinate:cytochrome c oxidoreductase subunit 3 [Proteomonas sulcata]